MIEMVEYTGCWILGAVWCIGRFGGESGKTSKDALGWLWKGGEVESHGGLCR